MKSPLRSVRAARNALAKFAEELPDLDANCYICSIADQAIDHLDRVIKTLPAGISEAKQRAKKHPTLLGKRR